MTQSTARSAESSQRRARIRRHQHAGCKAAKGEEVEVEVDEKRRKVTSRGVISQTN